MLETHTIHDDERRDVLSSRPHRVTDIKSGLRNENRINIYIDDKFFCSLDLSQVVDYKIKIGRELDDDMLAELKKASDFGKFYSLALEYALLRPRSSKELRDYLKKKTLNRTVRVKNHRTGEYQTKERQGYDKSLIPLVYNRLVERGYIDDQRFARLWVENRNTKKGSSSKKLRLELQQKGISSDIIEEVLADSSRDDRTELQKVLARKRDKYQEPQKLIQYLMRQGFNYSDILDELSVESSSE